MAITQAPPISYFSEGAIGFKMALMDAENQVWLLVATAAPTNGTSGDGAGFAGPGSLYIRASGSDSKIFINTNTTASPTWTAVGAQTA